MVALAIEAGVPRNALAQRHTDLKDEFYQRIKERGADNADEARLRATIARLRKTIASKNKELGQLRADVPALVRAVNQLTLELQEAQAEVTVAQATLGAWAAGLRKVLNSPFRYWEMAGGRQP